MKVGYIGNRGNLKNSTVKASVVEMLSKLVAKGVEVRVGPPNAELKEAVAGVQIEDMMEAPVETFDAMIIVPGGPAAEKKSRRYNTKSRLYFFKNSFEESPPPAWFGELQSAGNFDLKDLVVDQAVEAIVGGGSIEVKPEVNTNTNKENAPLDAQDIELVQQSFGRVAMLGADTVGKVIFMKIFKKAPTAIQLFSFKNEGVEPTKLFRLGSPATAHAVKVVTTVATAVSLLTDLDTLVPVLQGLGLKHQSLGVVPAHYDVVGEALIESLAVALGAKFTEPVKNAWLKVYGIIKKVMTEAQA